MEFHNVWNSMSIIYGSLTEPSFIYLTQIRLWVDRCVERLCHVISSFWFTNPSMWCHAELATVWQCIWMLCLFIGWIHMAWMDMPIYCTCSFSSYILVKNIYLREWFFWPWLLVEQKHDMHQYVNHIISCLIRCVDFATGLNSSRKHLASLRIGWGWVDGDMGGWLLGNTTFHCNGICVVKIMQLESNAMNILIFHIWQVL